MTYTYGNSQWGDLLTGYNGKTFTYDAVGNLLSDGERTYTWKHGRQLESMTKGNSTYSFVYNADGMRIRTDLNGSPNIHYVYDGSTLIQMRLGNHTLDFTYGTNGPVSVTWNGTTYYYVTNIQGDVISIVDANGTAVVNYSYDAWGNVVACSGSLLTSLGTLNPFLYRGYVYDQLTGLYYLQSRYYNSKIGRFISADGQISGVGGEVLGYNQFAYCFNNPVNMTDSTGNWPQWLIETVHTIGNFFEKTWDALSESCSISTEIGYGVGGKAKIGCVAVDASAIIVGDKWTYNSDGTNESVRRASLTVQAELVDNVNIGADLEYSVPLAEGKEKGLLMADGGDFDAVVGAYAYNFGIGYSTISTQDIELSLGISGYFIMGVGIEIGLNLSRFIEIWNEQ